jgi:hypothetical protein
MKTLKTYSIALACASVLAFSTVARAAETKSYQVTGPILELSDTKITVQKGDEKWEIARSKSTRVTGDLKVGAKVTVYYRMVAEEVEVKQGKDSKEGKAKKKTAS